ncbi:MAG TPA: SDR family oxidoreductase [Acidimicrobiales bacterium]|nr:SDR family oxidoreductase [Acidimicrobiales bacterium]
MSAVLQDKVALVTGSSSGIGAATARALAREGAAVVVNSASSVEAGLALATELPGASYVQADIADAEQARNLVAKAVEHHGRLDILVNNAGTTQVIAHPDLEAASPEVWRRILDVNVIGTWQVTVAAVPHLRASGEGAVVNVSSIAGHTTRGSSIPYATSKAAVSHMTELLANVLGPEIRVNAVAPGLVDTPWTAAWDVQREFVRAVAPMQRSGTPEDIADVILGLVTARYVTGEIVTVDGGLHLR